MIRLEVSTTSAERANRPFLTLLLNASVKEKKERKKNAALNFGL